MFRGSTELDKKKIFIELDILEMKIFLIELILKYIHYSTYNDIT